MATLYEIDNEILNCVDIETGEITDFERLEALQIERDEKIKNVALWYKNLLSDSEQYKAEKLNFAKKEQAAKNQAESLKTYLKQALNGNTYKTPQVNISFKKSNAVVIDDITKLDEGFLKYEAPTADKTAIKNAIKEGVTVTGAHIEERQNIIIK